MIAAGNPGPEKWGYSDPSYVIDRETGIVFLFCVKSFDAGFFHSQAGTDPQAKNVLHAVVMHSDDHGQTWSNPRDITVDITADPTTWASRFATSGEGIQLRYGTLRGRLLQQYAVRIGAETKALTVYCDDHGQTWQAGEPFGENMDENKVVELSDGTVMVNSRSSKPGETYRKVAYSHDGGYTYEPAKAVPELVDPRNNATLIRAYPNAPEGSADAKILLFANTFSTERRNGTVHISYDDGHTWARRRTFHPGEMQYCTLTALDTPGEYALAYEAPLSSIVYRQISREWIENNEDVA